MADILRIKRRLAAGGAGTPASLANAELAYNEASHTLYYGEGTGGSGGSATSVVPIAGPGAFLPLNGGIINTSLGSWSSSNYGKQVLLTGTGNNPALGITDNTGANLIGITNAAGVLRIADMPAYANSTTAPVNLLSLDGAGSTSHTPWTFASTTTTTGAATFSSTTTHTGAATFGSTLTLAADPTLALQAVTKQYADRQVATVATVAALRVSTSATLPVSDVQVRSYAGTGTKGGGRFLYVSTDTTTADNGGTIIVDASARRWYRDDWQNQPANVLWWGAVGDGATDDTIPIRNAVTTGRAVYMPAGTYRITGQINCTTKAQRIFGDNRNATFISITGASAGFVAGIFNVTSLEVGPSFAEFCVMCAQPDTSSRASLNVYPPMFYLDVTPRCQFTNVRMVGGLNGIYMNGNCGGFRASGCDFGCYSVNIYIDGNVDVTSFTDCQVWCFSATGIMTTNQQKIFWDANCYGIYSRRNDYLDWKGGLFMVGVSAMFDTGTRSDFPGSTYGHFTGTGFDSFGGLGVAAGTILTDNCTFSVGGDPNNIRSNSAVVHTGGNVTIRGAKFFVGNTSLIPNQALIWTGCGSGVAMMLVESCEFEMGGANVRAIYAETSNNAYDSITIANNKFTRLAGFSYTVGAVEIKGGSGTFTGNTCGPAAGSMTGAVPALGFPAGIGTWFTANNNFHGWASTVTGSTVTATNLLILPSVIGDAMPIVQVNGNATIGGMTYTGEIGASPAFAGILTTLYFAGVCTVNAGSFGVAGQFLLNNGAALTTRTGTHLTVRLSTTGNWVEVGRCV